MQNSYVSFQIAITVKWAISFPWSHEQLQYISSEYSRIIYLEKKTSNYEPPGMLQLHTKIQLHFMA